MRPLGGEEAIFGRSGLIIVVSGPSGVGKGVVVERVMEHLPGLRLSVSANTRPPRPGEREGVDYHFVSEEEFRRMIAAGEFFEWADVYGELKGTPKAELERAQAEGRDLVAEVDHQGAMSFRKQAPEAILVFVAPPSWQELERRLRGRHTESEQKMQRRLTAARAEIAGMDGYDFVVVNDDAEQAAAQVAAIITAARLRADAARSESLQGQLLAEAGNSQQC